MENHRRGLLLKARVLFFRGEVGLFLGGDFFWNFSRAGEEGMVFPGAPTFFEGVDQGVSVYY
ncbi:MAG: hypothetical protein A2W09_04860 [Deltaproteobacteria bacterium RBG_16_50_11]|nr:MAG: hypothetical protein A2W09_04860 [Deltaproteobacteria bacterium RBG_16_50_11]